jgi:hypothetical protein
MKELAGLERPQNSSATYDSVMVALGLARSEMDEPAVFGQICRFLAYGQAGTGFAHLKR